MTNNDKHLYKRLLNEFSPVAQQPEKIKIQLKPHQLAGIQKAYFMEQEGSVLYKYKNEQDMYKKVQTSIGIMGDCVGYGKTLLALGIISYSPVRSINIPDQYITTYNTYEDSEPKNAFVTYSTYRDVNSIREQYINTTLIIVPRGPVYTQWKDSIIKNTTLKCLYLDNAWDIKKLKQPSSPEDITEMKKNFEKYDAVLIKNTTLKTLKNYMCQKSDSELIYKWARIMLYEAHDTCNAISYMSYIFVWFISGTYDYITNSVNTRGITGLKNVLNDNMDYMLVVSDTKFVKKSFELPKMHEYIHKCHVSKTLDALRPFLTPTQIERIDASDLQGVIHSLGGGKIVSEEAIIDILTKRFQRELHNKKCELKNIYELELSESDKAQRIKDAENNVKHTEYKIQQLTERLSNIEEKQCGICLSNMEAPIILDCTHSFCTTCMVLHIENNKYSRSTCPECRTPINMSKTYLTKDLQKNLDTKEKLTKKETLLKIIKNNPDGKFLIFSRMGNSFHEVADYLWRNNIDNSELKGSTSHMHNILNSFKDGDLKVIMLNTYYAGSGIDISYATDVIIYHSMNEEKIQAIGRAYRVGRTIPLNVHILLHNHERN